MVALSPSPLDAASTNATIMKQSHYYIKYHTDGDIQAHNVNRLQLQYFSQSVFLEKEIGKFMYSKKKVVTCRPKISGCNREMQMAVFMEFCHLEPSYM